MGMLLRYAADSRVFEDHWWTRGDVVVMPDSGTSALGSAEPLKIATVWRAVNVLAAGVAMLPVDVFRRLETTGEGRPAGAEIARQDPWHNKIRLGPSPFQTSFTWRHQLVGQVVLGGNYYAQRIRKGDRVDWLWPLDPARCRPVDLRGDGTIVYEYLQKNGELRQGLTQDDIYHARGFTRDGILGVSVIELMRDSVKQSLAARQQRTSFLSKELRPSVVIKHPLELGDKAWEKLTKRFLKAYGGPSNAGNAMVLDEGMDIESFGFSSRDSQFVESEHFLVEEFLRYTGVPGVLAGYPDKTATYASAEAFMQMFVTHGLMPITKNLEQGLTVTLFGAEQDELSVRFNLDAMLRADAAGRAEFYRVLVELGILTRNEVRELENRNPLEGLDEPLTPMNMSTEGGDRARGRRPAPKPAGEPERRPSEPAPDDEEDEARDRKAHAVLRRAVARLLLQEVRALAGEPGKLGYAARFASDIESWRAEVTKFYGRRSEQLVETLGIERAAAAAYCDDHRDQVLDAGLAAVQLWGEHEVDRLLGLALGR